LTPFPCWVKELSERSEAIWRQKRIIEGGIKVLRIGQSPFPSLLGVCWLFSYPPSQKTTGASSWLNAHVGPFEAQRAPGLRSPGGRFGGVGKEGASADSAEEVKDTTGVNPWRLHADKLGPLTLGRVELLN